MKIIKKIFTATVVISLCINSFFSITVNAASMNDVGYDLYSKEITETLNIDGTNYIYNYYYNEEGNRTITVTNDSNGLTDILVFDQSASTIYLNNKNIETYSDNWINYGSSSNYVSWAQGVAAAVAAGAIAIVLGFLGASAVLGAIGAGSLAIVAASCAGGTTYSTTYKFNSSLVTQWKYVWSFTASTGDYYGPYTFLTPIV